MKPLTAILATTCAIGGAALGTRVPADTTTHETKTVVVPDERVAQLWVRLGELEASLGELEASLGVLQRRPPGLDGNEVRTLVETIVPEPVEVPDEATTTTTSAPKEGT